VEDRGRVIWGGQGYLRVIYRCCRMSCLVQCSAVQYCGTNGKKCNTKQCSAGQRKDIKRKRKESKRTGHSDGR
jgi:hypothetical protein